MEFPSSCSKSPSTVIPPYDRMLGIVVGIWRGGDVPQQWENVVKVLHKK